MYPMIALTANNATASRGGKKVTLTIISMPTPTLRPGAHRHFVTDREARQAARLAGLDYRLSGRSGTLRLP
ncbi:MAG: hypothetical protein IH960_14195, partial [Chloroflexi bacterium]|nr:hypothetical protein [Chloroflexota bacterium]